MRVKINRKLRALLKSGNKLISGKRTKQTGHILDADGVSTHLFDLACDVLPIFHRISIAEGIDQSDLCMCSGFLGCLDSGLHIAQIVQAVENTDSVNAVLDGLLYEAVDDIICVMRIAENVLAAEKHLGRGLLEVRLQCSQSLPRILVKETKAGIEGSAAPALNCSIANLIHRIDDRKHLLDGHSGGDQ